MKQESQEGGRAIYPAVERTHAVVVRCVELAAVLCLVADFLVLLTGVVSRYVFNHPIVWGEEVASILFLWLGMLGAIPSPIIIFYRNTSIEYAVLAEEEIAVCPFR